MNINKGYRSSELEYLQYKNGNVIIVNLENIVTHQHKGETMTDAYDEIAVAIKNAFESPNVSDSNGEVANVVDALDKIGNALWAIASEMKNK
jgi:hypothetical protein